MILLPLSRGCAREFKDMSKRSNYEIPARAGKGAFLGVTDSLGEIVMDQINKLVINSPSGPLPVYRY